MNKTETGELLLAVSAIDNRKITQQMIDGWADILRGIPKEIALEAHRMARRNDSVQYLEPKHIISYAREAAFALDRGKPKPVEVAHGTPEPTCKHADRLLNCKKCCRELYEQEHLSDAALLLYAKKNVFA